jgi:hypothetical protein
MHHRNGIRNCSRNNEYDTNNLLKDLTTNNTTHISDIMTVFVVVPKASKNGAAIYVEKSPSDDGSVPPTAPKGSTSPKVNDSVQRIHRPREYMEVEMLRMPVAKMTVNLSQYLYLSSGM